MDIADDAQEAETGPMFNKIWFVICNNDVVIMSNNDIIMLK